MYFFKKSSRTHGTISKWLFLKKLPKTSNASFHISKLRSVYPLQMKYKALMFRRKWHSGRGNTGRIVTYSKGPRVKKRLPFFNYKYRRSSIFFIAGLNYVGFNNKIASLVLNSQGEVSYLPSRITDVFFMLLGFKQLIPSKGYLSLQKEILILKPFIKINKLPYMLIQQKKNIAISHIERYPLKGIQYTRSFGSESSIIKLDTRTGLSIVKLSSGLKKVFSAFALASEGQANLKIHKNRILDTKSGNWRKRGYKPKVRGVAKNPVDHPHGGRTKAIKYPRTPWGKTTKFK